jgi:3-oxoacyl-[acyl-carrier protein] reductase
VIARKESDEFTAAKAESEQTHPGSLHFVPFDLAQIEGIPDLVKKLRKDFGPIYGLVNNAGMSTDGVLALTSTQQIEQVVRLNTVAHGAHQACGSLDDGRWRRAHRQHFIDRRVYRLQRAGGLRRHQGIADRFYAVAGARGGPRRRECECGGSGICLDRNDAGAYGRKSPADCRRSALKRMVDVEDVANAVDFLMGEGSRNITGTVMTVDAGNTA